MNKVILIGNLTRDPEFQELNSGVSVCRFTIAVNRNYSNADGERETDFFNCVAWRGLADNVNKYCRKGNKVCVSGQIQTRKWTDDDGKTRAAMDIIAESVEFLFRAAENDADGKTTDGNGNGRNMPQNKRDSTAYDCDDDDLPF